MSSARLFHYLLLEQLSRRNLPSIFRNLGALALLILHTSYSPLIVGEVQEWLNWQHWKCCERETVPWVRIPPSPPFEFRIYDFGLRILEMAQKFSGHMKTQSETVRLLSVAILAIASAFAMTTALG